MPDRSADPRAAVIVGDDRDPVRIANALLSGASVLVAGALGSGKTHLLSAVAAQLADHGADPLVIRAAVAFTEVPYAALEYSVDPRSQALRDDAATLDRPVLVIVDDAQSLDSSSAAALTKAIYRRRAIALVALEVPRARAERTFSDCDASSAFVGLWHEGMVKRVDLQELAPGNAEKLLDLIPASSRFDAATRAMIIGLADGSRALLRELAAQASAAVAGGRDPLDSFTDIRPHSRLGDALHAHVAQLTEQQREALALLGRLRRVAYSDATRFLPSSMIDSLIATGLVYEDGTVRRRLNANTVLATESRHQLTSGRLDELIERAAVRMIESEGSWWSIPVASLIAERWHGESPGLPTRSDAPPEVRARIALDAARLANDDGEPVLATAYAMLADDAADLPALALEIRFAAAKLARSGLPLAEIDPATLDPSALRRYLRIRAHMAAGLTADGIADALGARYANDGRTSAELDLAVAEGAVLLLDWVKAEAFAHLAAERSGADGVTQLRAMLISALSRIHDGDRSGAAVHLERADRLLQMPAAPASIRALDRVVTVCVEMLVAEMAGLDVGGTRDRLRDEAILAAREGSRPAIVMAGLGAALTHARAGDAAGAIAETEASTRRSAIRSFGPSMRLLQLSVARALALLEHTAQARSLLSRAVESAIGLPPLLTHSRALTESCILAAEGDAEGAIASAEAAMALSDRDGARLLHLRDLYQLAALGAADDVVVHKMRRIADGTDVAAAHVLADRAAAVLRGRKSMTLRTPVERLRIGAAWSTTGDHPAAQPRSAAAGYGDPGVAVAASDVHALTGGLSIAPGLGLTRREHEIADLVADGLSNREIAERLYLSVRTVESHIYQARAKAGARSRNELARMVVGPRRTDRGNGTTGRR